MREPGTTCDIAAGAEAPEAPRAFIAVVSSAGVPIVPLPRGRTVSVGRSRTSELHVDDPGASRLHCTLEWRGGDEVVVIDRDSRNGTRVDGAVLRGESHVGTGTEIVIGHVRLLVVVHAEPPGDSPLPAPIDDQDLVAVSPAMRRVVAIADRAAATHATILLLGESGVGKEVLARRIHRTSPRRSGPFVAINCAAIPETLAEAMLFGHERGAFTGAHRSQKGVFEEANGGTLFLDEVGDLSPSNQARLLRVLEDRTVMRVGSNASVAVNVRLVAATHRDLHAHAAEGRFRQDLLFRLDVVRIAIPPLRDRPEDVIPIAERLLHALSPEVPVRLSAMARRALLAQSWPGNVRELRNRIEGAIATRSSDVLSEDDLRIGTRNSSASGAGPLRDRVSDVERATILEALDACGGNQTRVAQRLGISRRTLLYRIEKFGLADAAYAARRKRAR